jgi:putative intracellular protease/amidase
MKRFILISALLELLAGGVLFFSPQLVPDLAAGPGSHMAMARMFGAAALGLGVFAFNAWLNADNAILVKAFFSSFLIFNLGAFISIAASFIAGVFASPAAAILHLLLAVVTAYYWFKNNLADAPRARKIALAAGIVVATVGILALLLPSILHQAGLHPDYAESETYDLSGRKALIITTSHGVLNAAGETSGQATGVFASEMTVPYYEFLDAGMEVDVASIEGGEIPIDPQSFYYMLKTKADRRYQRDEDFQAKVQNSLKIDDLDFTQYDVIWMAGGWGAAYDLGQSEVLGKKVSEAYYAQDPIIGSVCHGALGFIQAKDTLGNYLVTGRTMTGVTDKQIKQFGITLTPLHPEAELRKLGVDFKSQAGNLDFMQTLTVVDEERRFVTGQNQNSGHETAQKIMAILSENSSSPVLD